MISFRTRAAAFAVLVAATPLAARSAPAPHMAINSFSQLPSPIPFPYEEDADAQTQVAAAKARAIAGHKLLLIDLGGNWCPDCRILAATMEQPDLHAFVAAYYEVVTVNVGFLDKNLDIPARYGITGRLDGVPSLLVIDPNTDNLLDRGHIAALADARHMSPQALADWLAKWTP